MLARPFHSPFDRTEWRVTMGTALAGCLLLGISITLPRLWAQQPGVVADLAIEFVAMGCLTLASLFLPLWATRWRAATVSVLASAVFILLAGLIEGSAMSRWLGFAARSVCLLAAFATIWASAASSVTIRRFCWLTLVIWTTGLPLLAFLAAESSGEVGAASTLLHFVPGHFLLRP